jgi:cell fate regulator YaaT (PSP1 superfamily)
MSMVVGVRFKNAGKMYYFNPGPLAPAAGEYLIVETARGQEYALAVMGSHELPDEQIPQPLKRVLRVATPEDTQQNLLNQTKEKEAYVICQQKIAEHKLDMKLVKVEYTFDRSKMVAYFTSNGRVDFRALVKDLASVFRTRIELKQIGVRDEAKMLGGLGICGRSLCCSEFLGDFQPVSIKMAKEQNLSLNPTKISGVCGRLMCCLKYEQDHYEKTRKQMPPLGKEVMTPEGRGTVIELSVLRERVKVRVYKGNNDSEIMEFAIDEVQRVHPPMQQRTSASGKATDGMQTKPDEDSVRSRRAFIPRVIENASQDEEFIGTHTDNTPENNIIDEGL